MILYEPIGCGGFRKRREVLERSDRHDVEEEREEDWERVGCDRDQKGRKGTGE